MVGIGLTHTAIGTEGCGVIGLEVRPGHDARVSRVADDEFVVADSDGVARAGVIEELVLNLVSV